METVLIYEDEYKNLGIIPSKEWMLEKWNVGAKYLLSQKNRDKEQNSLMFVYVTS